MFENIYHYIHYNMFISLSLSLSLYIYIYIYIYIWRLSTLAKEFSAAARIMQSSLNELSTLVTGKV